MKGEFENSWYAISARAMTCSLHFSAHCVRERYKITLAVLDGVTVQPKKAESQNLVYCIVVRLL